MSIPTEEEISTMTPMMRQYYELKSGCIDSILFFRMGDFYEVFGEDAEEIAPILQIVLTSRERGDKNRIPFCGVPHHSAKAYWLKLLAKGYKISIADQVEDPAEAKGLVKREVIKTLSPGCIDVIEGLDDNAPNYLMAGFENPNDKSWALVVTDVSTGELRAGVVKDLETFYMMVKNFKPKEVLIRKFFKEQIAQDLSLFIENEGLLLDLLPEGPLRDSNERDQLLSKIFGEEFQSLLPDKQSQGLAEVISATLTHIDRFKISLDVFKNIVPLLDSGEMILSEIVIRDLEIFETSRKRDVKGSLFYKINKTLSPMGARLVRWSLARPLLVEKEIFKRHQAVKTLLDLGEESLEDLRNNLKGMHDLERLCSRVISGAATPIELGKTRESLRKAKWLIEFFVKQNRELAKNDLLSPFLKEMVHYEKPLSYIESFLAEEPGQLGQGDLVFRSGFDSSLDAKVSLSKNGEEKVNEYEQKVRMQTGISNLKIKRHKTFGLLIEVTKSNLSKIDESFIRKQTMVNCERFVTADLKELDVELSSAFDLAIAREHQLYSEVVVKLSQYFQEILAVSKSLSMVDMLQSFAWLALKDHYCMPHVSTKNDIVLKASRHPVVEKFVGSHKYVPNDIHVKKDCKHILITGPNMAGKSTVMRQTALVAIMAQAGCFVPATVATLPIFDKIFSRVGASDDLSQGQSTFMVEMTEAAIILRQATQNSLVILDEVGRGTSTQDGLAIASAILENLALDINCWSLFATHYHELVELSARYKNIKNMTTEVIEVNNGIEFTHRFIEGASGNSFGIEVAKLAGIPGKIIEKAQHYLLQNEKILAQQLETITSDGTGQVHEIEAKTELNINEMNPLYKEFINKIENLNINRMTPLQALNVLNDLKNSVENTSGMGYFSVPQEVKISTLFDS